MQITDISVALVDLKLTRPYKIFNKTFDKIDNYVVKIKLKSGVCGIGTAAISGLGTQETMQQCGEALSKSNTSWLLGQSIFLLPAHLKYLESHFQKYPAASAALDIALHDAYGKQVGLPLVDIFGRVHRALPTSITVGIKDIDPALQEASEYYKRGFRILKIKLGENCDRDIELVTKLRERFSNQVNIRVDINQGYQFSDFVKFYEETKQLKLELIEQPLAVSHLSELGALPLAIRNKIAADESLLSVSDVRQLVYPKRLCGIVNIKLMKCGGIYQAQKIATLAEVFDIDLMWGCRDESRVSIAAALHAAFASRRTKYLDLDGSFDLSADVVSEGFVVKDGLLSLTNAPGLGFAKF